MRIALEGGGELEVDDDISMAALAERLAARAGVDLSADRHLVFLDPDRFWQSFAEDHRVRDELRPEELAEPLPFRLVREERCMHGSPGIPGRGFLCGWC